MSLELQPGWPRLSIEEAHAQLTAPGAQWEMETAVIDGIETRVYKNTPPSLRAIFESSNAHGDLDFLVYEGERLNYLDHYRAVVKFANVLKEKYGVSPGDRVMLAMRNFPEWSVAFWAVVTIGAVIVPLNAWGTGPELEYGVSDSGSKVVIVDGERLERLKPHLNDLRLSGVIAVRTPADQADGADLFEEIVGAPEKYSNLPSGELPVAEIAPDDNVTIFYTSGTTGRPKGALGTHRNICNNLMNGSVTTARLYLRRGDPIPEPDPNARGATLLSVPFFHATGCHAILVPTLAAGAKLVLMHRWNPERALELIEQEKITGFGGVPAMAWQVLQSPNFEKHDLSSVQSVSYGGAPSAPDLVARIREHFPQAAPGNGYGLTETSSITTRNVAEDYVNRPESAGVAVPTCDMKVVDDKGMELPRGEVGELWIKGPNIVKGYWNKPEATAEAFTEGWLHSGDLVRMDEEGFVYILDRAKDMLIRGGENIYCVEVEDALYAHDAVMDAAVVGIPHKVLGEEVGAVVQVAPGKTATEEELQGHVRKLLAGFKVPIVIEVRNEPLPRNANGKIVKAPLRDHMKQFARDA
jgi:long-chain acyl-CoA synthetase